MNVRTLEQVSFDAEPQETSIFVGGLPAEVRDENLSEYFSIFGKVLSASVRISYNGKSKRYGFVTYASHNKAMRAMANKVHIIMNKMVIVEPAQEPSNKVLFFQSRLARKLYLGSIPAGTQKANLIAALSRHGPVEKITRLRTKDDNTMYCYVVMALEMNAAQLLHMKRIRFTGKDWLVVRPFTPPFLAREVVEFKHSLESKQSTGLKYQISQREGDHTKLLKQNNSAHLDQDVTTLSLHPIPNSNLQESNIRQQLKKQNISLGESNSYTDAICHRGPLCQDSELHPLEESQSFEKTKSLAGACVGFLPSTPQENGAPLENYRFNIRVKHVEVQAQHDDQGSNLSCKTTPKIRRFNQHQRQLVSETCNLVGWGLNTAIPQ
jgi:RNA recognition motif-containing protein